MRGLGAAAPNLAHGSVGPQADDDAMRPAACGPPLQTFAHWSAGPRPTTARCAQRPGGRRSKLHGSVDPQADDNAMRPGGLGAAAHVVQLLRRLRQTKVLLAA